MQRFNCCWCLFVLVVFVAIVTFTRSKRAKLTLRDRQVKDETQDDQGEGQKGDVKADNEQKSEHFTSETIEKQNNQSEQTKKFQGWTKERNGKGIG